MALKCPVQSERSDERDICKSKPECERRENASALLADVRAVGKTCLFSLCPCPGFLSESGAVAVGSVRGWKKGGRDCSLSAIRIFQLVLVANSILEVLSVS